LGLGAQRTAPTTIWPALATSWLSPSWRVAWPDSTTNTSAYGCRWKAGPATGCGAHQDQRDRDIAVIGADELVGVLGIRQVVDLDERAHAVPRWHLQVCLDRHIPLGVYRTHAGDPERARGTEPAADRRTPPSQATRRRRDRRAARIAPAAGLQAPTR